MNNLSHRFFIKNFRNLLVLILLFVIHPLCSGREIKIIADHPEEVPFVQKTWEEFVTAAEKKDSSLLKPLLMDTVRCYLCLENTEEELNELDLLRENNKNWFNIVYRDKIKIPADRFIREDVPILFNREMIQRLKKRRIGFLEREIDGIIHFEIMVTTQEDNEVIQGLEGVQHVFDFKKTDKGYRLTEISTIP